MAITCTHCSHVNPADAAYCYFDGSALNAHATDVGPVNVGSARFASAFVFPSGRSCASFDQLACACHEEWAAARDLLRGGLLEQFLGSLGRLDLAVAARDAAAFPDTDRALDQFLDRLPTQALSSPQLRVEPAEIDLGTLTAGADHHFELHLANGGMRLLCGAVVSDCKWLTLGDAPGHAQKLFQVSRDGTVVVNVRAQHLRAGRPQEGRLIVESNGGRVEVKVRALVLARPFPEGVLAGATTPRQLAEKAREAPREAARLFQSGAVELWYTANGWAYPVQGERAAGLGAVQQFFEALGLARAPRVELSDPVVSLRGRPGETLRQALQVRATEKRPVYASASSDQGWLNVGPVQTVGSVATIPLEVSPVPAESGQVLQARVRVTANGGQVFVVPVSLAVGPAGAAAPAVTMIPVDTGIDATPKRKTKPVLAGAAPPRKPGRGRHEDDEEAGGSSSRLLLVGGGVLVLLLLLGGGLALTLSGGPDRVAVAVKDEPEEQQPAKGPLTFKVVEQDEPEEILRTALPVKHHIQDEPEERTRPAAPQPVKVEIRDDTPEGAPGAAAVLAPVDRVPRVVYAYGPNARFGVTATQTGKRLTYGANGNTNNTVVRVAGRDVGFGAAPGRWIERNTSLPFDRTGNSQRGSRWTWAAGKLTVTQILDVIPSTQPVEVAPGQFRRLMDTVRVRYVVENRENRTWPVGLRVQVDTLIGGNDGVPFAVPGLGMVGGFADFPRQGPIPDFIQALEIPNLRNPGTVAHMTLKLPGLEPPARVLLTHWPGGNNNAWALPIAPLGGDSAVVLYWNEKPLAPGKKREFGFAYGLGTVASSEPAGKLGVTLGGSFEPGEQFTITAYVQNPTRGQTLTLDLPKGLERVEGDQTMPVPPAAGGKDQTSLVTWKAKVLETGVFPLRVHSNNGLSQSKTITIARPDAPTSGRLLVELDGGFEPGQVFAVRGTVIAPTAGQTLTLKLPAGLDRVEGDATQTVPAPGGDTDGASTVTWKVRVGTPGKFPVRVESSTGVARTKTLTIVRPDVGAGRFRLALVGDFSPGKEFAVRAEVSEPVEGQTLRLELPAGLTRTEGAEVQQVAPAPPGAFSPVRWKVKVGQAGKYPLRVASSTGVVQKKTLTIERPDDTAGRFALELSGAIAPGKEFTLTAKVNNPVAGQRLTLSLSRELQLAADELTQEVPSFPAGVQGTSLVHWRLRVLDRGTLRLRVASTTGVARTKTLAITEVAGDGGQIFGR
ncbi:MAG: zinc ribbon domain-containing protein [Gemmataceae bacterium]|nr:zinc ribbon domain-containing protein [Gemmataceae bacterium]